MAARKFKWSVSWVGEKGKNAGITIQGKSGWKCLSFPCAKSVQLKVDTTRSALGKGSADAGGDVDDRGMSISNSIPLPSNIGRENHGSVRYFTSLVGKKKQWAAQVGKMTIISAAFDHSSVQHSITHQHLTTHQCSIRSLSVLFD
jgi:hypothetical protein